jgi:hypothetical protein
VIQASPFTAMAQHLQQAACAASSHGDAVQGRSYAEDIRVMLEEHGALSARTIAEKLRMPSGRVGAIVKHDRQRGRIRFHEGRYELAPGWDEDMYEQIRQAAALLRRHGYRVERT